MRNRVVGETKEYKKPFVMKQLPKAEYLLLRQMMEKYHLTDPAELYVVLLRLAYELMKRGDMHGEQWMKNIINTWRSLPDEDRTYEL